MANVRLSKKFNLQIPDFIRAGALAAGTAALTALQQGLEKGEVKWSVIGTVALSTFVAYLLKNGVFEPPKVITTVETNTKAENATEKIKNAV